MTDWLIDDLDRILNAIWHGLTKVIQHKNMSYLKTFIIQVSKIECSIFSFILFALFYDSCENPLWLVNFTEKRLITVKQTKTSTKLKVKCKYNGECLFMVSLKTDTICLLCIFTIKQVWPARWMVEICVVTIFYSFLHKNK